MIGKSILHYRIEEKLGQGGMGVVFRATDTRLNRTVALKFLPPHAVGSDSERQRLTIEARAAAALDHPNICTIYGIEEADDQLFISMKYLPGETLEHRLAENGFSVEDATRIVREVAGGLAVAHAAGVIHRDIKAANIMLTDHGAVLLDFGLARSTSATAITQQGVAVGTPRCMSPEQARGEAVNSRTDIWSLGVVWYEMLAGRAPFRGDEPMSVLYSIINEDPEPPSRVCPETPAAIERIVMKMLSKNPAGRYRDAGELIAAIDGLSTAEVAAASGESTASIAVLPFENMSADPEQEYFCDGIAEDVINDLTRIEGLQVAARTTSFAYKGKREDIRRVGREIGVATVLEGSVRKAGNRVRVTAQLINVDTGYHVWSDRYDRDLEDVFAIQEDIARRIVDSLRVELTPEEDKELSVPETTDVEAYDLYLRGRDNLQYLTANRRSAARDFFEQAIAKDPGYARAHAGLANFYVMSHMYFNTEPGFLEKGIASAERAIELDPQLAEAHVALGYTLAAQNRYDDAHREFDRALELNPGLYEAHYYRARTCFAQGDMDNAVRSFERAAAVDPTDFQAWAILTSIHQGAGRSDLTHLAALNAVERCKRHMEQNPDDPRAAYHRAAGLMELGRKDEAEEWIEHAVSVAPDDPGVQYNVACFYARLGQPDRALDGLERALEVGFTQKEWIEKDPDLDDLRDHPRYKEILTRLD